MKFFTTTVLLSSLSSLALCARPHPNACLTNTTATNLVNGFASLLTSYTNATAESLLAADFTDTSDSINWLANKTLGASTFPSKVAFELGQGTQPAIGFDVLSLDAVTCTHIAFRWAAHLGQGLTPVKGINILYASNLNNTAQGWQIKSVFSEFNSGLWKQQLCQIGVIPAQGCSLI